jgi:hypothetical protein
MGMLMLVLCVEITVGRGVAPVQRQACEECSSKANSIIGWDPNMAPCATHANAN